MASAEPQETSGPLWAIPSNFSPGSLYRELTPMVLLAKCCLGLYQGGTGDFP